jgi:hypothetical protein
MCAHSSFRYRWHAGDTVQAKAKLVGGIVVAKQAVDARAVMMVSAVATVVEHAKAKAQPYAALALGTSHSHAASLAPSPPPE